MYSSTLGRWTSQDPIGYTDGENLFEALHNNPINTIDPEGTQAYLPGWNKYAPVGGSTGLAPQLPPMTKLNGDDLFREAAKKNKVPDNITELIIKTAKSIECDAPGFFDITHNYCEKWVDKFILEMNNNLNKFNVNHGGVSKMSGGGIVSFDKTAFFVPGKIALLDPDQDHTTVKVTFKDGSVFYIDCTTISSGNINNLTAGSSHFSIPEQIPQAWETYPRRPKPKTNESATPGPGLVHPGTNIPNITGNFEKDLDRSLPGSIHKAGPKN